MVDNARNHALLQTKLAELGCAGAQFKFIKAERPADWVAVPMEAAPEPAPTPAAAAAAPAKSAPARATAEPASKERPAVTPFDKNDFKNDPLIQKALEIFKGQIVEVRA
jgi:hypothetical protein